MTLRDWFAGQLYSKAYDEAGILTNKWYRENDTNMEAHAAHIAYRMADALLAERDRDDSP